MSKKYNKAKFQREILAFDRVCINPDCENPSCEAHHIKYKSQWGNSDTKRLGFDRDSIHNGCGLCAGCHYKAHNGLGIGQISGREFMFDMLNGYNENTAYYHRFLKIKEELKKSLIRKGVIR